MALFRVGWPDNDMPYRVCECTIRSCQTMVRSIVHRGGTFDNDIAQLLSNTSKNIVWGQRQYRVRYAWHFIFLNRRSAEATPQLHASARLAKSTGRAKAMPGHRTP